MATRSRSTREVEGNIRGPAMDKLDGDFDDLLERMKPYVLKLPRKSERQRTAMWIKKLCEPSGSSLSSRKNRNMYAQVLLAMLKRDLIEEPFSQQPEPGTLPTMPPYMSIYVDDPTVQKMPADQQENENDTPSWIKGELDSASDAFQDDLLDERNQMSNRSSSSKRNSYQSHKLEALSLNGKEDGLPLQVNSTMRNQSPLDENIDMLGQRQSPYQARRKSGGRMRYEPMYLREILKADSGYPSTTPTPVSKPNGEYSGYLSNSRGGSSSFSAEHEEELLKRIHKDREVETRTKLAEAKYHEDKLKLQQQHDLSVQKILERKNCELEEVKSRSRNKMTELETRVKKQDKRIVLQAREIESLKVQRDKQLSEIKNIAQEQGMSIQNDLEMKLHDKIAEYEQEKFEMQKKHTKDIQEILDETNQRVQKMESENAQQVGSLNNIVRNLEGEYQKVNQECEELQIGKIELEQEKLERQTQLRTTQSECDDLKESVTKAEKERQTLIKHHEDMLQRIENESKTNIQFVKQEKEHALSKASDTIANLKKEIKVLEESLKDRELQRQKEIEERTMKHRQEKADLENEFTKKIINLENELNKVTKESNVEISELGEALRHKSEELEKAIDVQQQQTAEAERGLKHFKRQIELSSKKMFDDTKIQMDKVEQDLEKSKISREKQAKEFTRQIENERIRHEKLASELKISFEQEKTFLIREQQRERDVLMREHEREKGMIAEKQEKKVQDLESQFRNKSSKDSKVMEELKQVNCTLREETMQNESLYKQQIVELGMLREEEKQTFKRHEEAQATQSRSEIEQQRVQLQRQHSSDMEQVLEKTNARFKEMEEEYTARSRKTQDITDALREEIQKLRNERITLQNAQEKRLNITVKKHEDEKASLKNHHSAIVKSLEKNIDRQATTINEIEQQARDVERQLQEKIFKLQFAYEEKMKGLLPVSIKEELEDTIFSLRQQVSILQSRADILQEEVDATNTLSSTWDISRFEKENIS